MVVPVRVRLTEGAQSKKAEMAYTLDATEWGVRLAGLRCDVNVGDKIEISYRNERAVFRVVWVSRPANSSEVHVGAECVNRDKNIWGTEFPLRADEYQEAE
jgi:hypothetical protein